MGHAHGKKKRKRMPLWKRVTLNLAALVVLAFAVAPFWIADTPEIFDESRSLHEALGAADADGKFVVAVVTADFCLRCQLYKRGALADPRVKEWIDAYAETAYVKWPFESDAMKQLQTRSFPMTVVMRNDEVISKKHGGMSAEELLYFLHESTASGSKTAQGL